MSVLLVLERLDGELTPAARRLEAMAARRSLEITLSDELDVDALELLARERSFDCVVFAMSERSGPVAARCAARLGAGIVWGAVDLRMEGGKPVATTIAYDGAVVADVGWETEQRIVVCQTAALDVPRLGSAKLEDAEIVVAAGGGVGGPEGLAEARALAEELGGAVASSSIPVVSGWAPPASLVGLSGHTVAPRLYIALGISGATQHTAGMRNARTVIAVNSDPDAPMLARADLAVVGDVREIVPRLTALIRERRA